MFGIQFYPTPVQLAYRLLSKLDFSKVHCLLEPSAGKGDKVKLVKACPELDSAMKVSVGDIGICACNPNDNMINVKFGKINYPFIFCSRLEVVDDRPPTEAEKFNRLIDIAIKEYDGLYTDEIDFFVEFLRKKIMEVSK